MNVFSSLRSRLIIYKLYIDKCIFSPIMIISQNFRLKNIPIDTPDHEWTIISLATILHAEAFCLSLNLLVKS